MTKRTSRVKRRSRKVKRIKRLSKRLSKRRTKRRTKRMRGGMTPEQFNKKYPNALVRKDKVAPATAHIVSQRPDEPVTNVTRKRPTRDEFLQQKHGQPDHSFKTDTGTIHCEQAVKLHGCSDKKVEKRCRYECGKKRVEDLKEKEINAKHEAMVRQRKLFRNATMEQGRY